MGIKKISIRKDLLLFLKRPDYSSFQNLSLKEKAIIFLKIITLTYLVLIIVNIPVVLLKKLEFINEMPMKTEIFLNSTHLKDISYKPYFLFSTFITVPFLEEISFRLFLTKFNTKYFIISVSLLLGIFLKYSFGNIFWIPESYFFMSTINLVYILVISFLAGGCLFFLKNQINRFEILWNKNIGLIIYTLALLFSVGHINNLKFSNSDIFFMPLTLLPFFILGLTFSYLRIRLGIIYSIALHFILLALTYGLPELMKGIKAT